MYLREIVFTDVPVALQAPETGNPPLQIDPLVTVGLAKIYEVAASSGAY